MRYEIKWSNGSRHDFPSLRDAHGFILERYPAATFTDCEDRILFWENAAEAQDDDGARALGSIREIEG